MSKTDETQATQGRALWQGVKWQISDTFLVRDDEPLLGLRWPETYGVTPTFPTGVFEVDQPEVADALTRGPYHPATMVEIIRYAEGDSVGYSGYWEPDHYQVIMSADGREVPVSGDVWGYFRRDTWEMSASGRFFRISRDGDPIAFVGTHTTRRTPLGEGEDEE